jgi:hypothetical protein
MDSPSLPIRLITPPGLRERVSAILRAAGLAPTTRAEITLVVLTSNHVPESLDQLMVDGGPHLVLRLLPDSVTLGPFVLPGQSPCARCVAVGTAEESDQAVRALAQAFSGPDQAHVHAYSGPDAPWHLLAAGAGLAARDLVAYDRAEVPESWSATCSIAATGEITRREWRRHPWCGCGWFDLPVGR